MRIATLQFSPVLGDVQHNMARADALLADARQELQGVEVLVLPELAFSGYNFPSLRSISPYLEPTASGPTAHWAAATAKRLRCIVCVGYPEREDPDVALPRSEGPVATASVPQDVRREGGVQALTSAGAALQARHLRLGTNDMGAERSGPSTRNYNSLLTISPTGALLAHHRKTHLYYTDETWALPSPSGWTTAPLPLPSSPAPLRRNPPVPQPTPPPTTRTTFGICMDLNPHLFLAPWSAYELATHARRARAQLLLCSMAWLTRLELGELDLPAALPPASPASHEPPGASAEDGAGAANEAPLRTHPDLATLHYWLSRLAPLISARARTVVVVANRSGVEPGSFAPPTPSPPPTSPPALTRVPSTTTATAEPPAGHNAPDASGYAHAEARYAGSSCVLGVGGGAVRVEGVLGRGEEGVLVVDVEIDGDSDGDWDGDGGVVRSRKQEKEERKN